MKNKTTACSGTFLCLILSIWLLAFATHAQALIHPGILHDAADLNRMKANLNVDPWKTGYLNLSSQPTASLNYTMQGPFQSVGREPNVNRSQYESDMTAVYHQALMYSMTGNSAYATKAISIINAWAATHTTWSGNGTWSGLMRGDYGYLLATGAEILRYTYPGWISANTTTASNYLLTMYWNPLGPWTNPTTDNLGAGNQGLACLKGLMSFAIFFNDQAKFDYCVNVYRNSTNCVSLNRNSLGSGQNAESGRDQAHSMMEMSYMTIIAEMGRKQGVTFYSDLSNRVLALNEYWYDYNLGGTVPYSVFGPCGNSYTGIGASDRGTNFPVGATEMAYGEYVVRGGWTAPFTEAFRSINPITAETFLFNQEPVPATPVAPAGLMVSAGNGEIVLSWRPSLGAITYNVKRATVSGGPFTTIATGLTSPNLSYVNTGLTNGTTYYYAVTAVGSTESLLSPQVSATPQVLTMGGVDLNGATPAGSCTYSGGTFTVKGGGNDLGSGGDTAYFAYQTMTGNGAITARLASGSIGKVGIQMRNGLGAFSAGALLVVDSGNQVRLAQRAEGDANLYWGASQAGGAPKWLRIQRNGNLFQQSCSSDGITWTILGTVSVAMNDTINVGMIVCSRTTSATTTATFDNVTVGSGNILPDPWVAEDVGTLNSIGGTTFSNGVYSVQGSGGDIGGGADSFHYASQVLNGDSTIIARLTSLVVGGSANDKAGIMIRESNAGNARSVCLFYDRAVGAARLSSRSTTGGNTSYPGAITTSLPCWLKLQRVGNVFTASISTNGTTWSQVGTSTVTMTPDVLSGLSSCSRDTALNTATFDNVTAN